MLDRLNDLCTSYKITDSLILELSTMSIPLFFIEDLHTLQISSINLISTVNYYHLYLPLIPPSFRYSIDIQTVVQ